MCSLEFLDWCLSDDVVVDGVRPGFVAKGWRGVLAEQDLPPDHAVMIVPERLLMSPFSAAKDVDLAPLLERYAGQLTSHQVGPSAYSQQMIWLMGLHTHFLAMHAAAFALNPIHTYHLQQLLEAHELHDWICMTSGVADDVQYLTGTCKSQPLARQSYDMRSWLGNHLICDHG